MPFLPNLKATLRRARDEYTATGSVTYADPEPIRLAVVTLGGNVSKTSVRADSSASRGAAEELRHEARLMMPVKVKPRLYDRVEVGGWDIEIKEVIPRWDIFGKLDHYQVDGDRWTGA